MTKPEFYMGVGTRCLRNLLEWPDHAITTWQRGREWIFSNDLFDTELPAYYFSVYFLPRCRSARITREQRQLLQARIGTLLDEYSNVILDDAFDWTRVKAQIDALMQSFGTSLQRAVDENSEWIREGMPDPYIIL